MKFDLTISIDATRSAARSVADRTRPRSSNSPVPMLTNGQTMLIAAIAGSAIDIDHLIRLIN